MLQNNKGFYRLASNSLSTRDHYNSTIKGHNKIAQNLFHPKRKNLPSRSDKKRIPNDLLFLQFFPSNPNFFYNTVALSIGSQTCKSQTYAFGSPSPYAFASCTFAPYAVEKIGSSCPSPTTASFALSTDFHSFIAWNF